MSKVIFILLCCSSLIIAHAQSQSDALRARDEVLQALKSFNPASVLKGYTPNPSESSLQPQEGSNDLGMQGLDALKNNAAAYEVYNQAGSRTKVRPNSNSPELRYAEQLLENPDSVLEGACYKEAGVCTNQAVTKTCEEALQYKAASCKETLEVHIKDLTQSFSRIVTPVWRQPGVTFNIQSCDTRDVYCTAANTAILAPNCEHLLVTVTRNNKPVLVTKEPTCNDPTVTLDFLGKLRYRTSIQITVTEQISEEQWKTGDCERIRTEHPTGLCFLESSQACLEPNQVKVIDGFAIQRPCWGRFLSYQCGEINSSSCEPLMKDGCSQTASACTQTKANRCERFAQTFQCMEKFCLHEKTVCPEKIACADGSCDSSQDNVSDDLAEGLSRLGALSGVAGEVSANQIKSGTPAIFTGKAQECKKYPLGFRDCCTDSGWGDWVKHCPKELQDLQQAKEENRVVYLGSYKNHKLGAHHYTYCIFSTKLASIVQIQGRGTQLGIPYGTAEYPDCRGLTPEELERINFAALDLSPMQQEFMARVSLPNNSSINSANQTHIESLNQKGRAYD